MKKASPPTLASGAAPETSEPRPRVRDFELFDQHTRKRTYHFPKPKVTVLTIADQNGSTQIAPWIECVHDRYGDCIDIDGIADVSMIPRMFHGMFRQLFRKQVAYSVMLDWSGDVVKQFSPEKGVANIYVIDRKGRLLKKFAGAANEATVRELHSEVARAMADV